MNHLRIYAWTIFIITNILFDWYWWNNAILRLSKALDNQFHHFLFFSFFIIIIYKSVIILRTDKSQPQPKFCNDIQWTETHWRDFYDNEMKSGKSDSLEPDLNFSNIYLISAIHGSWEKETNRMTIFILISHCALIPGKFLVISHQLQAFHQSIHENYSDFNLPGCS